MVGKITILWIKSEFENMISYKQKPFEYWGTCDHFIELAETGTLYTFSSNASFLDRSFNYDSGSDS